MFETKGKAIKSYGASFALGFALAFLIAMEERALRGPVTAKQTTPAPASPITPVSAE